MASNFKIAMQGNCLQDRLHFLWHYQDSTGQILGLLPVAICWSLWRARNSWIYEAVRPCKNSLIASVMFSLQEFSAVKAPVVSPVVYAQFASFPFLKLQRRTKIAMAISWLPPNGF